VIKKVVKVPLGHLQCDSKCFKSIFKFSLSQFSTNYVHPEVGYKNKNSRTTITSIYHGPPGCQIYDKSFLLALKRAHFKKSLTQLLRFCYTKIASLQPQTIHFVVAFEGEKNRSLISLFSLYIFKKKNVANVVNAKIAQVKKISLSLDIHLHSKVSLELVRTGLGDLSKIHPFYALLANTAIRCRSSTLSRSSFSEYSRRTARFTPAPRFISFKKKLRSLKRKCIGQKEDESHCGRDSKAAQGERSCVNDIWSNNVITLFKKNYLKIKRQIQTGAGEVCKTRQAIQLFSCPVYGNSSKPWRNTKMEKKP